MAIGAREKSKKQVQGMSNPKTVLHNKFEGIKKENLRLKLKGYLCFTAYIKIISRPIIDLNVKGKIIKFLGDNKGEYLHDLKREGFFFFFF